MKLTYGKQTITQEDKKAVLEALDSPYLTTGPFVERFEKAFAQKVGSRYAVSVSNGTAALHLACLALGVGEGDEVITTALTFAATANCALYCGAKVVFADIGEDGNLDCESVRRLITDKTKLIIPMHYAGLPCDLHALKSLAQEHGIALLEDACHALGSEMKDSTTGSCDYSDLAIFSFHPVKHITTGEGGMITTNSDELYKKLLVLRTHGISKDISPLDSHGPWYQEMHHLGFNYRLTDIQAALGLSQLKQLDSFVEDRRRLARRYRDAFSDLEAVRTMVEPEGLLHSYHLFVILVENAHTRLALFSYLKEQGIHCQVHYLPVYLHPYYQNLGYEKGLCPRAEDWYERAISLPLYPLLSEEEQDYVICHVKKFFNSAHSEHLTGGV